MTLFNAEELRNMASISCTSTILFIFQANGCGTPVDTHYVWEMWNRREVEASPACDSFRFVLRHHSNLHRTEWHSMYTSFHESRCCFKPPRNLVYFVRCFSAIIALHQEVLCRVTLKKHASGSFVVDYASCLYLYLYISHAKDNKREVACHSLRRGEKKLELFRQVEAAVSRKKSSWRVELEVPSVEAAHKWWRALACEKGEKTRSKTNIVVKPVSLTLNFNARVRCEFCGNLNSLYHVHRAQRSHPSSREWAMRKFSVSSTTSLFFEHLINCDALGPSIKPCNHIFDYHSNKEGLAEKPILRVSRRPSLPIHDIFPFSFRNLYTILTLD